MRQGKDGHSYIEVSDIDMRAGFHAFRWFWAFFALLVIVWGLS